MKYKYGALEAVRAIEEGRHKLIEVRWRNAYDGETAWHQLEFEKGMLREGIFPLQAEYRIREL